MVPGIEPDRPRAIAAQVRPQQVHQRALAGAPAAGDGDRDRRLRGLVAQEARQGQGDRLELQRVPIRPVDRAVGAGRPGDALALDEAASHEAGAKEADQQQQGRPGHEHPGCRVATKLAPAAIERLVRFGLGIGVVQHEQLGPRRRVHEFGPGLAPAPGHQRLSATAAAAPNDTSRWPAIQPSPRSSMSRPVRVRRTGAHAHRRERHGARIPVRVRAAQHQPRRADDQQMSRVEKCHIVPCGVRGQRLGQRDDQLALLFLRQ